MAAGFVSESALYQYSNMAQRPSGQNPIFGGVFFISKSLLRIERQRKLNTFEIFVLKASEPF